MGRYRARLGTVAVVATVLAGQAASAWAAGSYAELKPLPGGTSDRAFGTGHDGLVVGDSGFSGSGTNTHAAVWKRNGEVTDLGTLPGDTSSTAFSVNSSDATVVGRSSAPPSGP